LSYAAAMKDNKACCRTTQLFVNTVDNQRLDAMGFSPFAQVISGMEAFDQLYSGYGEQPNQNLIYSEGASYLEANFPLLDYLVSATIISQ